jgi:hypothetical protein
VLVEQFSQLVDRILLSHYALGLIGLVCIAVVAIVLFVIVTLNKKLENVQTAVSDNVVLFDKRRASPRKKLIAWVLPKHSTKALLMVLVFVVLAVGFNFFPRVVGQGELLAGHVTHVRDGDTIEVGRRPIRLNGLTCDERGTRLGDRATQAM